MNKLPIDDLYFRLPSDWVKPCKIYPYPHLKAIYKSGWEVREDIREWIKENDLSVKFIHEIEGQTIHLIHFENKSDAVRFKLVWGGQ